MLEEQVSHKAILFVGSLAARESKRIFMRFRNVTRSTSQADHPLLVGAVVD